MALLPTRWWKKYSRSCERNPAPGQPRPDKESEGRLRFRKRPSCFDGGKPNSVGLITQTATIIYLTQLQFCSRRPLFRLLRPQNWGWAPETLARIVMRRYPRINGPAALPLFCLAPHGVFPASRIAPRAVSSYLAFSTLPVPLLPKNRRCLFCDTFRHRNLTIAAPAYFTRHVAVWCSDFPPASHSGSPAIICHRRAT